MDTPEEQRDERNEWSTEGCSFKIVLPFPPSVNTLYPIVRGRKILSKKGREYKQEVKSILDGVDYDTLTGNIDMCISLILPDRRRRDIDNYNKALLDCLTEQQVYKDDSQIVYLTIRKSGPLQVNGKNIAGAAEVAIWEHPGDEV
jgi:Holliday junction resolvase RusA-like endonuclease